MIPRRINNFTKVLGAPKDWNPETDGECVGLPVRIIPSSPAPYFESAWEPTSDELRLLNTGGSVILRIVNAYHPPVSLWVESQDPPISDAIEHTLKTFIESVNYDVYLGLSSDKSKSSIDITPVAIIATLEALKNQKELADIPGVIEKLNVLISNLSSVISQL